MKANELEELAVGLAGMVRGGELANVVCANRVDELGASVAQLLLDDFILEMGGIVMSCLGHSDQIIMTSTGGARVDDGWMDVIPLGGQKTKGGSALSDLWNDD